MESQKVLWWPVSLNAAYDAHRSALRTLLPAARTGLGGKEPPGWIKGRSDPGGPENPGMDSKSGRYSSVFHAEGRSFSVVVLLNCMGKNDNNYG